MIREFSVKANPTNNNARILLGIFLGAAAVLTVLCVSIDKYRGVVGIFAMVAITAAVLVYNKYVASQYFYDITFDHNGDAVLVVRQSVGNRATTLSRVSICDITSVKYMSAVEYRAHKTPAGYRKFSYMPTVAPRNVCLITLVSPYESAEMLIEVTEGIANVLAEYSRLLSDVQPNNSL